MDSTSGIAYRQHLLSSVTQILVSGSQATLTVFSTNIGVGITGGTVDTMVTEAGTRLVEVTF